MAHITKLKNGRYRAQVCVGGIRKSANFDKKIDAKEWSNSVHFQLDQTNSGAKRRMREYTCLDVFKRWETEVLPTRNGKKWDALKIKQIMSWDGWKAKLVDDLQDVLIRFRDYRLQTITNNSCNRELNLISAIFNHASKEWKLSGFVNPVKLIKRPPYDEKPRKERWSDAEVAKVYKTVGYKFGDQPTKVAHLVCLALSLAVETAMRVGEICKMQKQHYYPEDRYVFLPTTKNGEEREVPLTNKAIEILNILAEGLEETDFLLRGQTPDTMGSNFRKIKSKAGFPHKHFHDARHEAATRLSKVFTNTLELSAVTGHKRLDMLKRYYNPTGKEMGQRLAGVNL